MLKNLYQEKIFTDENKPTPQCHASTIVKMDNGNLMAAWFGGKKEKDDDVEIWISIKDNNGWSNPICVSEADNIPSWNPVLFIKKDGTVCLFYKKGKEIADWKTMIIFSKDFGKTWSAPKELVPGDETGGRGPVKNKALCLSNGDWLAPASTEQGQWRAFIDISTDEGETWTKSDFVLIEDIEPIKQEDVKEGEDEYKDEVVGTIQPTLWESAPGKVHMILRTNCGYAYRSDSEDYGRTWCKGYKTQIPNNNSGLDVVKLDDGSLVLICNPVSENWGPRTPLVLLGSDDNGTTWKELVRLEDDPDPDSEYSYPAIIKDGNMLYMTYTYNRQVVSFATIEIE